MDETKRKRQREAGLKAVEARGEAELSRAAFLTVFINCGLRRRAA